MARLILKDFQCINETNELGSDSPYFVFFIGKARDPGDAEVVTIRDSRWDEQVNTGNVLHPNAAVSSVDSNTLVLCALMEEDLNTDITTGTRAFRKVRDHMRNLLGAQAAGGSMPVAQLAEQLLPEFRREIDTHRTNDDLIDVIHVPTNIDLQQHGAFSMESAGARYLVWFSVE